MNQDRFIVSMIGVGYPHTTYAPYFNVQLPNSDLGLVLGQTQLDYSSYQIAAFNGVSPANGAAYGDGALIISVTADDVFQGDSADVQTVKRQFDAVMNRYFDNWDSVIVSQQVIPAHQVAVNVNPNTGHVATNPVAPLSPNAGNNASGKNWFDRTFFNGAGALTGVGIAVLVVLGAVVVTQKR